MPKNSEASERFQSIGRAFLKRASIHSLLAEEEQLAGEKYLALATRLDAAETAAEVNAVCEELKALSAETCARLARIGDLLPDLPETPPPGRIVNMNYTPDPTSDYANFLRGLTRTYSAESAMLSADAVETERLADRLQVLAGQLRTDAPTPLEVLDEVTALLEANTTRIRTGTKVRSALWNLPVES